MRNQFCLSLNSLGFFIERSFGNPGALSRNEESSTENAVTITMPEAK